MSDSSMLNLILFLPVIGMALLVPVRSHALVRQITFWFMVIQFALTVVLYLKFQAGVPGLSIRDAPAVDRQLRGVPFPVEV